MEAPLREGRRYRLTWQICASLSEASLSSGVVSFLWGRTFGTFAMRPLILVGTDDIEFYLLLDYVLDAEGFRSMLATSAEEIQDVSSKQAPDAVLLDCRPQSFSCLEVFSGLRQRRETQSIPAIALISPGAEADHVQLLKCGIEDAITRPVSPAKIVERMRLIVVGKGPGLGRKNGALKYADVEMDLTTHRVHRNGKEIHLGPIEYKLLQHLLQA
ncbi:MAG: response regulator transcription factor, partial [Kiloniellales bacterium]|nr:response regulator transcription factor [Kiloniellales bacterium]